MIGDVCQPVLVSRIEGNFDPELDWIFLRITARHVLEVELKAARVLNRLDLQSLQKIETSEMHWRRLVSQSCFHGGKGFWLSDPSCSPVFHEGLSLPNHQVNLKSASSRVNLIL